MLRYLTFLLCFSLPLAASAQGLENYAPPPMFGGSSSETVAAPATSPSSKSTSSSVKSAPVLSPEDYRDAGVKPTTKPSQKTFKPEKPNTKPQKAASTQAAMPAVKPKPVEREVLPPPAAEKPAIVDITAPLQPEAASISPPPEGTSLLQYKPETTDLTESQKLEILSAILAKLKSDPAARVTILAYASPDDTLQSGARRIALARGVAIREYIMSNKIGADRIDLKALGDTIEGKGDIVELILNDCCG
ncbi:MAG: OmpA family protein [Alphaproteobacteria bacterium]|nr:OmpA family protein [Alphaproteobacteria bacterium]